MHTYMPSQPIKSSHSPDPKQEHLQSSLNHQSQDSSSSHNQMYTIESFQIEPNSLTHQQVTEMINDWGAFQKIQQKFYVWEFRFQYQKILNIVPDHFYTVVIHYVFMKKLSLLIKDFDQNQVLKKSLQLKEIYKTQSLSGKLTGKKFDYLLLVTVKLIAFFLGAHTHEIIINTKLEAEIYAIIVYVLLGTQVGQKTYSGVLQKYKQKPFIKINGRSKTYKQSTILPNLSKQPSEHQQIKKNTNKSKKRKGRTQCKSGTALFHKLSKQQDDEKITQIRKLVKQNLSVKQFVPKPKIKQNLNQVLAKAKDILTQVQELKQVKKIQKKQMKHKTINYTQISCSLDLSKSNSSLNNLHNYSLKIKPQKMSKYYKMINDQKLKSNLLLEKQPVKLPKIQKPKEQAYSYQAILQKKMSSHYWNKIIDQMKQNKFQNIQHFPPISAKIYFQKDQQQQDTKINRGSEALDVIKNDPKKENYVQAGNVEFLTQRIVQSPKNMRETHQRISTVTKITKNLQQSKIHKTLSIQPSLQQLNKQINILEYSASINIKQIYKNQKAFMNVYSSQPLDDLNKKFNKKSFVQLKEIQKNFTDQCQKRREKIQHSYFR